MKISNEFPRLLDLYRVGACTEKEKMKLYKLASSYLLRVTNYHYKTLQKLYLDSSKEKQFIRLSLFLQFIDENRDKSSKWILFAFYRRFHWFEFLVDCKYLGIALFTYDVTITKQMNSKVIRDILLGISIHRNFVNKTGRIPNEKELSIELIKHHLKRNKKIRFSLIQRCIHSLLNYFYCKRYADPIRGYREEIGY